MDNVISFPKNKINDYRISNKKIYEAFKMLNIANTNGIEFEIVLPMKYALEIFEVKRLEFKAVILTTNLEETRKKHPHGYVYYEITGEALI